MTPDEKLLSVTDVAALLGVPPRWVYTQYEQGRLPGGKIGRYLRFRKLDIDEFVRRAFEV